jgi:hypothetical protein
MSVWKGRRALKGQELDIRWDIRWDSRLSPLLLQGFFAYRHLNTTYFGFKCILINFKGYWAVSRLI